MWNSGLTPPMGPSQLIFQMSTGKSVCQNSLVFGQTGAVTNDGFIVPVTANSTQDFFNYPIRLFTSMDYSLEIPQIELSILDMNGNYLQYTDLLLVINVSQLTPQS
jgi:hypothetical protein